MIRKKKLAYAGCFLGVALFTFVAYAQVLEAYKVLNLAYAIAVGIAVAVGLGCLIESETEEKKHFLCLLAVSTVIMLPFLTNNFLYGDDYWGFTNQIVTNSHLTSSIGMRRPFNANLFIGTDNIGMDQSNLYRALGVLISSANAWLLYHVIRRYRSNKLALCVSVLYACCVCIIDSIAYMSTMTVLFSLLFSELAFICYDQEEGRWAQYGLSFFLLLSAFCFYQIATPVFFVMFVISRHRQRKKSDFLDALKALIFYGAVSIAYLIVSSMVMRMYSIGVAQSARAEFVHTFDQVVYKAMWFIQTVIPQALIKGWAVLLRLFGFTTNCLFYEVHLTSQVLEQMCVIILGTLIAMHFLDLLVRKRFGKAFVDGVAIILSYYPFLILPESYVLSYYMIPIVLLLVYYEASGTAALINRFTMISRQKWRVLWIKPMILILLTMCVLSGNVYAMGWVNYNRDSYMYIKQTLSQSLTGDTQSICVIGTISPYVGGNPYVVFSVKRALESLGYDSSNYEVLQMDNEYYISAMTEADMESVKLSLSLEEFEEFSKYYFHDDMYGRWLYNHSADQAGLECIKQGLKRAGLAKLNQTNENIVICLDGFNRIHQF